jgi:hypothetical protein
MSAFAFWLRDHEHALAIEAQVREERKRNGDRHHRRHGLEP